jgi:1-acyl-sn-glycerol-3-phosphate acyltransferase
MTLFRSALFFLWFAATSAMMAIFCLPLLAFPRGAAWVGRHWSLLSLWGLRVLAGTDFEVRGARPPNGVLVAVKHMSMWDTMAIYALLDNPAIIFKKSLSRIPFYGWYLVRARMIAIDRDGKAGALREMAAAARAEIASGRSIAIFPEGTRKKPGAPPDYKSGVAGLYGQLDVACYPVALNSGLFWTGSMGFVKKKGTIVIEFLPPIPSGLPRRAFMARLQAEVEDATAKLVEEGLRQLSNGAIAVAT